MFDHVNAVEYGLTASIWTNDLLRAHRATRPAIVHTLRRIISPSIV
jgi:acyl-CoA reductase-like NAD-dependent aldehyde dehydrogenase